MYFLGLYSGELGVKHIFIIYKGSMKNPHALVLYGTSNC
jgi:hypothetical protein